MKLSENILENIKSEIGEQLELYLDDNINKAIFILPFKDSYGDNFVIRISDNDNDLIIDDAGTIQNQLFIMSETVGGFKANRLVSSLVEDFNAYFDKSEGLVEFVAKSNELTKKILHFTKMLLTIDTMLIEIGKDAKESARPHRQSLGLRASQRIRRSLRPLIDVKKVNQRVIVDGLTVPDWLVDFAYKPQIDNLVRQIEMVILISVDLAVLDPIVKATYAFSRALDIKAVHNKYDIRIAYDTHGQNSNSAAGARFIHEHQIHEKAYTAIDLSKSDSFTELVRKVNIETGMKIVG